MVFLFSLGGGHINKLHQGGERRFLLKLDVFALLREEHNELTQIVGVGLELRQQLFVASTVDPYPREISIFEMSP